MGTTDMRISMKDFNMDICTHTQFIQTIRPALLRIHMANYYLTNNFDRLSGMFGNLEQL